MRAIILGIGVLVWCFLGCKDEVVSDVLDRTFQYANVEVGNYWIYALDSVIYYIADNQHQKDSIHRELLIEVVEKTVESAQDSSYVLKYSLNGDDGEFYFSKNIYIQKVSGQLIHTEDNLPFIKLLDPLRTNASWNGNALFDEHIEVNTKGGNIRPYSSWNYRVNDSSEDEVVKINQANEDFLIGFRRADEWYAKGVGLIKKEMEIYDTQCTILGNGDITVCIDLPWIQKAELGWSLNMQLIEYGNE